MECKGLEELLAQFQLARPKAALLAVERYPRLELLDGLGIDGDGARAIRHAHCQAAGSERLHLLAEHRVVATRPAGGVDVELDEEVPHALADLDYPGLCAHRFA